LRDRQGDEHSPAASHSGTAPRLDQAFDRRFDQSSPDQQLDPIADFDFEAFRQRGVQQQSAARRQGLARYEFVVTDRRVERRIDP